MDISTKSIRWMIRRDLPDVLQIERDCFEFNWTQDDFTECMSFPACNGYVAEQAGSVVAFMVIERLPGNIEILNFAVSPLHQHADFGTIMLRYVIDKAAETKRGTVSLKSRESNHGAHGFFRHHGFKAVGLLRKHYEDSDEDAFLFRLNVGN